MISKLKQACGFEYTSKLQRMFQVDQNRCCYLPDYHRSKWAYGMGLSMKHFVCAYECMFVFLYTPRGHKKGHVGGSSLFSAGSTNL